MMLLSIKKRVGVEVWKLWCGVCVWILCEEERNSRL